MAKPAPRHPASRLILGFAFLSGGSALVYELCWSRYLHLLFGVSAYAVATVVACYMLGLAAGSLVLGRVADRVKNLVLLFVGLEVAIGVYGALSPLLFGLLSAASAGISAGSVGSGRHLIRLLLAVSFLILPTFLMGGTFPVYLKILSRRRATVGADAGRLYAMNTLGGAVAVFVTGFFLIRALGIRGSIFVAVALNLALGAMVYLARRRLQPASAPAKDETDAPGKRKGKRRRKPEQQRGSVPDRRLVQLVLGAFAISGFTSLAYEVLWTRILTLFFRDTIYDFAIVLSTFLVGLVLGSALCSRLLVHFRQPAQVFGLVQILIGLASLLCLHLIAQLPQLASHLQSMPKLHDRFGDSYWVFGVALRFGYAFLVMLVPTTLLGSTLPLVACVAVNSLGRAGRELGLLTALNTIGATLGALLAGFVLVSALGLQHSLTLLAAMNVAVGLAVLGYLYRVRQVTTRPALVVGAVVAVLLTGALLPRWDRIHMSTYILEIGQPVHELFDLEFYREDATGITSVVLLKPYQTRYLTTNRLYTQNTSAMNGPEDHRRLGHIPMLLHPDPQEVLVLGLGAGITLRGVLELGPSHVDCVELSPGVIEAARHFPEENGRATEDGRVRFVVNDGRNHVATTRQTYDVIVGDLFFPMSSGSSALYSEEHFAACLEHLSPGGLMAQWLPVHQLSEEEIRIIARTFQQVFPHTSLWVGMIGDSSPAVGCVGTRSAPFVDVGALQRRYGDPRVATSLKQVGLGDPRELLSLFVMQGDALARFVGDAPVNTDDRPIIEFENPLSTTPYRERGSQALDAVLKARESILQAPVLKR